MIYLDNSATTRVFDQVADTMLHYLKEDFGNASSLHGPGVKALRAMNHARQVVAESLGAEEGEITFTCGGTEGNNMLLRGIAHAKKRMGGHIISTMGEHPAVLETLKDLEGEGFTVTLLPLLKSGRADLSALKDALREDTILVSIMHVNNETGAVNDLNEVRSIIGPDVTFISDGVQAYLRVPLDVRTTPIDGYIMSSHKICGPKGVGAVYIRKGLRVLPVMTGGGQEKGLRSGTENVPGIAGFARAVELWKENGDSYLMHMRDMKEALEVEILAKVKKAVKNGEAAAPHILNIAVPGVKGEILLHALEEDEVYVSTGSACSGKKPGSHVLRAMGLPKDRIDGALRFSIGPQNDERDAAFVADRLAVHANMLQSMRRK